MRELEAFAERGVPDVTSCIRTGDAEQLLNEKQKELIRKLRLQLADLEKYAYEVSGPSHSYWLLLLLTVCLGLGICALDSRLESN